MSTLTWTNPTKTSAIQNNPILASIAYRYGPGFETWSDTNISYTLNRNDPNPDGEPTAIWTSALSDAIELAHADLEAVTNLNFTEIPDFRNGTDYADIDYWYYSNAYDGAAGYSYGSGGIGVFLNEYYVYSTSSDGVDGFEYGGVNYWTVIHEILHNLGTGHPHEGENIFPGVDDPFDTGQYALNQALYTVMSYNGYEETDYYGEGTTGQPSDGIDYSYATLGAFDIALMQILYGANTSTAAGDTVYDIASDNEIGTYFKSVWDTGGTDEFRYSGLDDVTIDLRAATLDINDGPIAGGILSRAEGIHGGFTIANGVVIENATGSYGDDDLMGNAAGNILIGASGFDRLEGREGADLLLADTMADAISSGYDPDDLEAEFEGLGFYANSEHSTWDYLA